MNRSLEKSNIKLRLITLWGYKKNKSELIKKYSRKYTKYLRTTNEITKTSMDFISIKIISSLSCIVIAIFAKTINFKIFNTYETKQIESELIRLTHFVDENSLCLELEKMKNEYKEKVKKREEILKQKYPNFKKSQKFPEYEKYVRKNKCKSKFLLKHDCVKFITPILRKEEVYSIENLDKDFPDMCCKFLWKNHR